MKTCSAFFIAFLLAPSLWSQGADDSALTLVPAQLFHQRNGLGNVLAKLKAGQSVKIAYLGGSITAANGWRIKSREWFAKQYPKAQIEEIHAAIGGTGSDLGVYRVERDALRHQPDLMFVEFAVNDGGTKPEAIWRALEGIVRQTWARLPHCDLCFVYTFKVGYETDLRQGRCPQAASADERLAEFYGIPSINFALKVVEMESAGELIFQADKDQTPPPGKIVFSNDGVHPLDAGHAIYNAVLAQAIQSWVPASKPVNHEAKLAKTFVPDHFQAAKIVEVSPSMLSGSWKRLAREDGLGKNFGQRMDTIWEGAHPGDTLHFRFKGSNASLYDLLGPDGGQVIITVDGETRPKPVPRFDSYCTYHRIATLSLAMGLDPDKVHEITVEIHPDQPDRHPVAFRLKNPEEELKDAKFQGNKIRAGGILLLGDLVE
ncbi:MAG: SGNH/GDSL hydrolase family protein [Verrucomicrobiales bacterium]|nr:SGNH/GDSL hydrolase family protein [Verrucomicrobiae bacterium]MCP5552309.1 SGNH/GDSL hydrolase family protein [Akkermansiaceae bacterium]